MAEIKFYNDYPNTDVPDDSETANKNILAILKILGLDVDTYDTGENYGVDDFVVYQKELWRCTEATTGEWNETKWVKDSIIVPSEYMSSLIFNERLFKKPKVLYNNTTGSSGSITLSESPIDGKLILIEFTADGITRQTSFFYKPNVKFSLLLSYIDSSNYHMLFESTYTINDKDITFNKANNNLIASDNGVYSYSFNSYIKINKVLMY